MLGINIICVGKLKEKFYIEAANEYAKRLLPYCKLSVDEVPEVRLNENSSHSEIEAALFKEAALIEQKLPKSSKLVALCIEGEMKDSVGFADFFRELAQGGASRLCFIIGGSNGLHASIKAKSDLRLSMSPMTFPHHLARVMLLEQLYRAVKINEGAKYHK